MADITMCKGTDCVIKLRCYRYTAPACEYRQSYFVNVPLKILSDTDQKCDMFWSNEGRDTGLKVEYTDEQTIG
jgi:hypothetical protein